MMCEMGLEYYNRLSNGKKEHGCCKTCAASGLPEVEDIKHALLNCARPRNLQYNIAKQFDDDNNFASQYLWSILGTTHTLKRTLPAQAWSKTAEVMNKYVNSKSAEEKPAQ